MSPNVLYAKKPKVIPSQSTSTDTTTEDYTSTLVQSQSKKTKIGTKDIFLNEIKGTDLFHNPTTKPQSLAEKRRNTSIVSFVPDKKVSKTKRLAAIKQMLKSSSNKNVYGIDAPDLKSKALLHNQYIRRSKYWLFKAPELQINFEKIAVKYCYWQYDNKGYQGIVQFVNRQKFTAVNTVLGKDIVFDWIDEIKNNGMKYLLKNEFELSWEYGTRPLEYKEFEKLEPKSYASHWDTYIRKKAEEKWMQQIMSIKPVSDDSGSFENDENENNVNNQQKRDSKKKKRTKKEKYLKEVNILSRLVLSGLSFTEIYLIEPVMARRHKDYVFELIKSETSAKAKKRLI